MTSADRFGVLAVSSFSFLLPVSPKQTAYFPSSLVFSFLDRVRLDCPCPFLSAPRSHQRNQNLALSDSEDRGY
jgi:hypothetical protein